MYLCIYTHTYLEYLSKSSIWPFSQWHHLKPRVSFPIIHWKFPPLFLLLQFQIYLFIWFFSPMCHWGFGPFLSAHTTLCLFLHLADSPSSSQSYFSFRYALQGTVNSFLKMLCHQLQLFCLLLFSPCLSWWHSCHLLSPWAHGTSLSASASSLSFPGCHGHFQSTLTAFSRLQVTFSCSVTSSSLMSARHLDCGNLWTEGYTVL